MTELMNTLPIQQRPDLLSKELYMIVLPKSWMGEKIVDVEDPTENQNDQRINNVEIKSPESYEAVYNNDEIGDLPEVPAGDVDDSNESDCDGDDAPTNYQVFKSDTGGDTLQAKLIIAPSTIQTSSDIIQWMNSRTFPRVIHYNNNEKHWLRNVQRKGYRRHLLAFSDGTDYDILFQAMGKTCNLDQWRDLIACGVVKFSHRVNFSSMKLSDGYSTSSELRLVASGKKGITRYALDLLTGGMDKLKNNGIVDDVINDWLLNIQRGDVEKMQ